VFVEYKQNSGLILKVLKKMQNEKDLSSEMDIGSVNSVTTFSIKRKRKMTIEYVGGPLDGLREERPPSIPDTISIDTSKGNAIYVWRAGTKYYDFKRVEEDSNEPS
jgi:hypothetical protein